MKVGVLALQGGFAKHADAVRACGAEAVEVRLPRDLVGVDALVLPGGESGTMSMLLERSGLFDPIAEALAGGLPALGTCAGMILLATEVLDGRPDQRSFGVVDLAVRRNGYGRQVDSFDVELDVSGPGWDLGSPFPASFIRAPVVERVGEGVTVLATVDDRPVLCTTGPITVASFHPELPGEDGTHDLRIHRRFLEEVS